MTWLERHLGWTTFVVSFLIFLATTTPGPVSIDIGSSEVAAWTIVRTGAPWIDNLAPEDAAPTWPGGLRYVRASRSVGGHTIVVPTPMVWIGTGRDGHRVIDRTPGAIVAALPAYAVAALLGDRSGPPPQWPERLTTALLAAWALALMAAALAGFVPRRAAVLSTLGLGFATPFWSAGADQLWTHCVTAVGIAGMAYAAQRDRWWLVGVFAGVGLWGRLHVAVIAAVVGLAVASRRRNVGVALKVALPSLALMGLAAGWGKWVYGVWRPQGGYGTISGYANAAAASRHSLAVNELGLLVSPEVGLFVWTPVLLVLIAVAILRWRGIPDWAQWLAVGGALYLVIQGGLDVFTGGSGFWGYRLGLETVIAATPALAFAIAEHLRSRRATRMRPVLIFLVGLQVGAIGFGAVGNVAVGSGHGWRDFDLVTAAHRWPLPFGTAVVLGVSVAAMVSKLGRSRARAVVNDLP